MRFASKVAAALAALLALLATVTHGQEIIVIAHPNTKIPVSDLRDVYLGETQYAGSTRIVAVHNSALQSEFTQRVLGMDAAKYRNWWTKKAFRDGLNPLQIVATDVEVIEFIKANPGAIGYIDGAQRVNDLLVIQRIPNSQYKDRERR
jgi:ABC-type phosphate transport system substrate-binding protein